jgi:hypothetical protein
MSRLHAFGDSFTYGYELSDCDADGLPNHSYLTYSALYAKHLDIDYICHAVGYGANNGILRQIKLADIHKEDTCLVMWSFSVRFAFMFEGAKGWRTINKNEDRWWWDNVDQQPEQCLDRSIDSILAAQAILESIGCNYTFLCNNIELQDEIQYNSKWLDKSKWLFLPQNHEMINSKVHPGDDVHRDVFNILKERLNGTNR